MNITVSVEVGGVGQIYGTARTEPGPENGSNKPAVGFGAGRKGRPDTDSTTTASAADQGTGS